MTSIASRSLGLALAVAGACLCHGCTGEDAAGVGELSLSVSGGAAVRDGFPLTEGSTTFAFADGWALQFTRYTVSIGQVVLTDPGSGALTGQWDKLALVDLKKAGASGVELATLGGLSAVRHEVAFEVAGGPGAVENRNAEPADAALMQQQGWSVLVEGTATHADKGTVQFRLGLPLQQQYCGCINGKDKTQGISVESSKVTGAFIELHAIHLFWDTLATGDEDLRFDAFAAMRGADDLVTEEELKAQDLNDLRDEQGNPLKDGSGKTIYYNDNGRLAPGQQTLYHFVLEAVRASAHFNGEGLCKQRVSGTP